jgi:hypothetical protein
MPVRICHSRAVASIVALAASALILAACSSGSSTAAPSAGASQAGGSPASCPDLAAIGTALAAQPHWRATGMVPFTAPAANGQAAPGSAAVAYSDQLPSSSSLTVNFTGIQAGGIASVQSMTVGPDQYTSAFGSQAWVKTAAANTGATGPLAVVFAPGAMAPATDAPAVDLPGTAPCVLAFKATPPFPASDTGVLSRSSVQYVVMRVDPATSLPVSIGFVADPTDLHPGDPGQAVLSMDYATAVEVTPPDARMVIEPGTPGVPVPTRPPGIPALPLP